MAYIGNFPKFRAQTYRPQSADPSNPTEGMVQYSDGTARTEGLWVYKNAAWELVGAAAFSNNSSSQIINLGLAASVGSSALTVAVKTAGGIDATAGDKVTVAFRNATSATGQYSSVDITAALSMVVSSGSTLGQTSAVASYVYVYLINNSGTAELAVSRSLYDNGSIVSTTAEGGAGGADSASVIYSTTARSNVACRLVGRLLNTQATAGTWATTPSEVSLQPFDSLIVTDWQSYTPSWTASSVNPAIVNGSIVGSYRRVGDALDIRINLSMGSSTTYGTGTYRFSLPLGYTTQSTINGNRSGMAHLRDDGTSANRDFAGVTPIADAIYFQLTAKDFNSVSPTIPFTWANGDSMDIFCTIPIKEFKAKGN